jgi:hypothetical protein
MRSEWVPVSAAALVTGVMALVLGQMLNPGGAANSPAGQLVVAAEYPGRWLAMAILFFAGASALILGMPAVMTLFEARRGRGLGILGMGVFTVGCVGLGGLAALMLMFRALALESMATEPVSGGDLALVTNALDNPGLRISLTVWVYGFIAGVLFLGLALLRAKSVPGWVPSLLFGFLAMQLVMPFLGEGALARVGSALGLILLAAGFTGIATNAVSDRPRVPVTHSLVSP